MLSAIIPTFNRESVLIDTIEHLLGLSSPPDEIIIVDQTASHTVETEAALRSLCDAGRLRRIRLAAPSIPAAMNRGLLEARGKIALFLDDDIVPDPALIETHRRAHEAEKLLLVAGRVIQPWQEGADFSLDRRFHFASHRRCETDSFMGGNFSLNRSAGLSLGGFDENFVKVAYGFEVEFAFRWRRAGGVIRFEPDATIHHLKAREGGTRAYGDHLTTSGPEHSVGAYYCALRTRAGVDRAAAFLSRPMRSVATKFHLRRPWRVPITLAAELRGMAWALQLAASGPRYIDDVRREDAKNV
jgi:GT2 family glycosyltransferase